MESLASSVTLSLATVLIFFGVIVYFCGLVTYRLYFHPIAHFSGPKLAAATKWYEFYFDVLKGQGGQYAREIERMHDRYGPIVRVNPDELHIRDPDYYDVVYANNGKRDKWPPAAKMAGNESNTFATVSHELHRRRRAAGMSIMSKQYVLDAVPMLQEQLESLAAAFAEAAVNGSPLDLGLTFLAFTTDVAGQFLFRKPLGMQSDLAMASRWKAATHKVASATPFVKQFPGVLNVAKNIPLPLFRRMDPNMALVMELDEDMRSWASEFLADATKRPHPTSAKSIERPRTIFEAIWNSSLPASEKTAAHLKDEGRGVMLAGSETSARVLTRGIYELASNPETLCKVRAELDGARISGTDELRLHNLEGLPWLSAVVKECLRISALVTSRLPLQPHEALRYRNWTTPPMTPVSLTPYSVLKDPNIFEEPDSFLPQRWLEAGPDGVLGIHRKLDRYFVPFSKGSRMCLGINLAYAEMYLALATIILRFDFELYDVVKERDIDYAADCFLGEVRADSPGVRVKVRELKDAI